VPGKQKNITKTKRKRHSKRAAIEPVIGHLKSNYRMNRNFYKGLQGDIINVLLAAAAMNFKRVMNLWRTEAILRWLSQFIFQIRLMHICAPKMEFLRVD
jgi:transposase, IS5 family